MNYHHQEWLSNYLYFEGNDKKESIEVLPPGIEALKDSILLIPSSLSSLVPKKSSVALGCKVSFKFFEFK
jgi:hypothetical protein